MKRLTGNFLALLGVFPMASAEIKDAPSVEDINARREQSARAYENKDYEVPAKAVEIRPEAESLKDSSAFLVGAYGFTIVPKGAVVGEGSLIKVASESPKGSKLMKWDEFTRVHRAGIRLVQVPEAALAGGELSASLTDSVNAARKANVTSITTLTGKPVSLPQLLSSPKS